MTVTCFVLALFILFFLVTRNTFHRTDRCPIYTPTPESLQFFWTLEPHTATLCGSEQEPVVFGKGTFDKLSGRITPQVRYLVDNMRTLFTPVPSVVDVEATVDAWISDQLKAHRPSTQKVAHQLVNTGRSGWGPQIDKDDCSYWMFVKNGEHPAGYLPKERSRNAFDSDGVRPVFDEDDGWKFKAIEAKKRSNCGPWGLIRRIGILGAAAAAGAVTLCIQI